MKKIKVPPVTIFGVLGVLLVIMYMLTIASGFKGKDPGDDLYYSKAYNAFWIFTHVLKELDYQVITEDSYATPEDSPAVMVYFDVSDEDLFFHEDLFDWVSEGNTLFLGGAVVNEFSGFDSISLLKPSGSLEIRRETWQTQEINTSSVFNSEFEDYIDEGEVLARSPQGPVVIEEKIGSGQIIYIAESSLFNNMNLEKGNNIILLNALFSPYRDLPFYLREKSGGAVFEPTLVKKAFSGELLYVSLQAVLILLFLLIYSGKRFFRPEMIMPKKQRKISEHIHAVGLFYRRAGAMDLISTIDKEYFRYVVCQNTTPSGVKPEEIADAYKESDVLEGFIKRQALADRIKGKK